MIEDQKKMRWGDSEISFIRPIRWLLLIFGDENISTKIFGIKTGGHTYGNKCLSNKNIDVYNIDEYFLQLENSGVEIRQEKKKS